MQAAANARVLSPGESKAAKTSVPPENTARASRVVGRKVIDSNSAMILGFVDELYFHLETRQIAAIRVRARFWARVQARLRGKKSRWVVPTHLVQSIGSYAVVVDRVQAAINIDANSATNGGKKVKKPHKTPAGSVTFRTLVGQIVVTETGELLGKVLDVLLNDLGKAMQQYEIDTRRLLGPRGKRRLISAQTRALGDVLLVPTSHRQSTPLFARADSAALAFTTAEEASAQPVQITPQAINGATPEWLC